MQTEKEKELSEKEKTELLIILKARFEKNKNRHPNIDWIQIEKKLEENPTKLWSLDQMKTTGGEPDVIEQDKNTGEFIYVDCSAETPKGRRSLCYDREALDSRKEFKPVNSVIDLANSMGIELLNENQYRNLQTFGKFDTKTSSWLKTPEDIRNLGGAIFGDYRYGNVFIYHNGAESYYAVRGFRGLLKV